MSVFSLLQTILSWIGFFGVLWNPRHREDDKFVELDESEAEMVRLSSECQLQISTVLLSLYNMAQTVMCTLVNVLCFLLLYFGALTGEQAVFLYFHVGWAVVYMWIQIIWSEDLFLIKENLYVNIFQFN